MIRDSMNDHERSVLKGLSLQRVLLQSRDKIL